jgi:hypothetical protein
MLLWSGLGRCILGSIVRGFEESFYPEVLPEMDLRIVGTSSNVWIEILQMQPFGL